MKLGAVNEPILPRKFASDLIYAGHDCDSAGGTSANDEGIFGIFSLLDILVLVLFGRLVLGIESYYYVIIREECITGKSEWTSGSANLWAVIGQEEHVNYASGLQPSYPSLALSPSNYISIVNWN